MMAQYSSALARDLQSANNVPQWMCLAVQPRFWGRYARVQKYDAMREKEIVAVSTNAAHGSQLSWEGD
jgi:hypothetical protein